jgi:hypothetical protein
MRRAPCLRSTNPEEPQLSRCQCLVKLVTFLVAPPLSFRSMVQVFIAQVTCPKKLENDLESCLLSCSATSVRPIEEVVSLHLSASSFHRYLEMLNWLSYQASIMSLELGRKYVIVTGVT